MRYLIAILASLMLPVTADIVFSPSSLLKGTQSAGIEGQSVSARNRFLYWKVQGIEPGSYSARLSMSEVPENCLYLNGQRLNFDSASPFANGFCTAQTDFIHVRNGDEFMVFSRLGKGRFGSLTLSKQRLAFAPQKHLAVNAYQKDLRYSLAGTRLGERLQLAFENRSGRPQTMKLEVKILDFYRVPVARFTETVNVQRSFRRTFDYRRGGADQYRAIVTVTDDRGHSYEEVFPYLRDWTDSHRSRVWLTDNWLRAEIGDDFTLKTRTLQPQPPPGAKWQKAYLPTDYQTHLAWFKKDFQIPRDFSGKRWFIHFDRITYEADIYLNGKKIHHYGTEVSLAPFDVEITGKFNRYGNNTLLLALRGNIASLHAEELKKKYPNMRHNRKFYAYLTSGLSEISILGMPQQFIGKTTVITSFRNKSIQADAEVPEGCTLKQRVLHEGKEVLKLNGTPTRWNNPILWGPVDFPLLTLESSLWKDGRLVDVKKTRFGFREIWADGMTLRWNGKPFRTEARTMNSWTNFWLRRGGTRRKPLIDRMRSLKANGNRMIRHVYDGGYYAELADEEGIIYAQGLLSTAGPDEAMLANDGLWKHKTASDLAMVSANCNAPSIFTWYVSNEMVAFSDQPTFRRIRDAVRAVRQADPTRFVEAGCDLDLRGESQIVSTHYPVEGQVFRANTTYMPDMVYWRPLGSTFRKGLQVPCGQGKKVCNIRESTPITWGTKPIILNETGWITFYQPPLGFTRLVGDDCLTSYAHTDFCHQLFMKHAFQGARDADVTAITPWRQHIVDDFHYTIPDLDVVLVQQYHSFTTGAQPVFDVNIFHDILKQETLDFFWKLTQDGRVLQSGRSALSFDFCERASQRIVLNFSKPGNYTLTIGLGDRVWLQRPLTVRDGMPLPKHPSLIPGTVALNKDQLLQRAAQGETIILLPRQDYPAWLPGGLSATSRCPSVNFTFHPQHPLLKGLKEQDLSYWYPHHRTGTNYFLKPHTGNVQTIIEAGGPQGLKYAGLVTVPHGKGGFIYCALDLQPEINPVAAQLLKNLLSYRFPSYAVAGVLPGTSPRLLQYLKRYGIETQSVSFGSLQEVSVLIVDGQLPLTPGQLQELKAFSGTVFVQHPGSSYQLKTSTVEAPAWQGRAIRVGYVPELAGLTNQELYFREPANSEEIWANFHNPKLMLDPLGHAEILTGTPMLYPRYLTRQGNFLFCNLNWTTSKSTLTRQAQAIISTLMTNLGVKVHAARKLELPPRIRYTPLDLTPYLDRSMADDVANDGKGGFTDQGPDMDMREFKLHGIQNTTGIPFQIEFPKTCLVLTSKYRKGGYGTLTLPIGKNITVLAWLHTHAYTSHNHHYSILVNYADGSSYEIRMEGGLNLVDWGNHAEKPALELDTLTTVAHTVPHRTLGKASLFRTAWVNPAPQKPVTSITFKSMNRGVPVILAVTIGTDINDTVITPELENAYRNLLKKALACQQNKRYQEAITLYRQALDMIPERLQPYRSIGSCYESLNDYANALKTYQKSLAEDINQPDLWQLRDDMKKRLQQ